MIKNIKIGKKDYILKNTASVLLIYKNQFGTDYLEDVLHISTLECVKNTRQIGVIGYQLLWSMLKAGNSEIPDPDVFYSEIPANHLTDLINLAGNFFLKTFPKVQEGKNEADNSPFTAESLSVCCTSCGLTLHDMENYTLDFVIGYIDKYVDFKDPEKNKPAKRKATQADFDRF